MKVQVKRCPLPSCDAFGVVVSLNGARFCPYCGTVLEADEVEVHGGREQALAQVRQLRDDVKGLLKRGGLLSKG